MFPKARMYENKSGVLYYLRKYDVEQLVGIAGIGTSRTPFLKICYFLPDIRNPNNSPDIRHVPSINYDNFMSHI